MLRTSLSESIPCSSVRRFAAADVNPMRWNTNNACHDERKNNEVRQVHNYIFVFLFNLFINDQLKEYKPNSNQKENGNSIENKLDCNKRCIQITPNNDSC